MRLGIFKLYLALAFLLLRGILLVAFGNDVNVKHLKKEEKEMKIFKKILVVASFALVFPAAAFAGGGFESSNDSWGSSQSDFGVPATSWSQGSSDNESGSGDWTSITGGITETETSADGNFGAGGPGTEAGSSAASSIGSSGSGKDNGKFGSETEIGNSGAAAGVDGAGEAWSNTTTLNGGFVVGNGVGATAAGGAFNSSASADVDDGAASSIADGSGKASSKVNPAGNGSAQSSLGTSSHSEATGDASTEASASGALGSGSINANGGGLAGSFGGSDTSAETTGNGQATSNSSSSSNASSSF